MMQVKTVKIQISWLRQKPVNLNLHFVLQNLSYDVTVIHVINIVMTTRYITLSTVTSNVRTTSVTTMQFFVEINKHCRRLKSHLKGHMKNRILHL